MGWDYIHKPSDVKGYLISNFTFETPSAINKCLDIKIVNVKEAYLAVERKVKDTNIRSVFCVVIIMNFLKNKTERFNFGYKSMNEGMYPYYYNCPESILNQLTEPYNDGSKLWREKCHYVIEAKNRIKEDVIVEVEKPIKFSNGMEYSKFLIRSLKPFKVEAIDCTNPNGLRIPIRISKNDLINKEIKEII